MMRILPLFALALAVPALAAPPVDVKALPATGPAKRCLMDQNVQLVVPDAKDVVMVRSGKGWYRSVLPGGCAGLTRNRIIVRRTTMGQLCRNDVFEVVDVMGGGMSYGLCRIGMLEPVTVPKGARF